MPLLAALLALATWKTYPLDGVIVDLPAPPRTVGDASVIHAWLSDDEGSQAMVSVGPSGLSVPELTLASTIEGATVGGTRVVAQKDLVLNGWPGLEATFQSDDHLISWMRAYHLKDRIVMLVVAGDEKVARRIFDSVRLAPRLGRGGQAQAGPVWKTAKLGAASVALPGDPSVEADRLTGAYGNRTYTLALSKGDALGANAAALRATGGKLLRRESAILADRASERSEARAFGGRMTFLAESVVVGGQVATLTALVPNALKDSPEVARFFASLKIS